LTVSVIGIADYAFQKVHTEHARNVDWSDIFSTLACADAMSVCHSFSESFDTFATREQISALLAELRRSNCTKAHAALSALVRRQQVLQPYIFFETANT
jgi:hypothetical protein